MRVINGRGVGGGRVNLPLFPVFLERKFELLKLKCI